MRYLSLPIVTLCIAFQGQAAEAVDYAPMVVAGQVSDRQINESSGLAASRTVPGFLWTHNDSGDGPRLFLLRPTGDTAAEVMVRLPPGAAAIDWEDIASFDLDGQPYLLVADAGDGSRNRKFVTLWLVPEPSEGDLQLMKQGSVRRTVSPVARFDLTYADGPHDVESMMFDPAERRIWLVSKEWSSLRAMSIPFAGVYSLALPPAAEWSTEPSPQRPKLQREATLSLKIVTGADLSPDGQRAVLLTYGDAWQYVRQADQSWAEAFAAEPTLIPLGPRGQGEAVCYGLDGRTLYLSAEKVDRPLWKVEAAQFPMPGE